MTPWARRLAGAGSVCRKLGHAHDVPTREFVDDADARISVRAKAFNYGLGCFGGIRAYGRDDKLYVFRLDDHVQRLVNSARILGLESPHGAEEIAEIILELLRRNEARGDHYIRPILFVTRTSARRR